MALVLQRLRARWLHPNMYVFIIPRLMDRQKESERERQRQREKANEGEGRKDAAMSSGIDVKRAGPSRVLPRARHRSRGYDARHGNT